MSPLGCQQNILDFLHPIPHSGANEQNMTWAQQQKAAPGIAERRLLLLLSPSHALLVCTRAMACHTCTLYIRHTGQCPCRNACGCRRRPFLRSKSSALFCKTAHSKKPLTRRHRRRAKQKTHRSRYHRSQITNHIQPSPNRAHSAHAMQSVSTQTEHHHAY